MFAKTASLKRFIAGCFAMVLAVSFNGCSRTVDGGERLVLENGVTVLLQPITGVQQVGVEAFYDVGFMHEPKGLTQAAHLIEHLVCHGSSASFQQREAMQRLNALGMANAETLPSRTHYDYMLPADQLQLVLQIEKERLTSLAFDKRLIRLEAGRCYQETDAVEANPASGMLKHAFMAFSQAWRHNARQALVRGGLAEMSVGELRDFHRDFYRSDQLTLVIVGDFNVDEVKTLVRNKLGQIKHPPRPAVARIDWDKVPKRQTVQWDAKVRGVCLGFPPPEDRTSAAALSLYGSLLLQHLSVDAQIKQVADMALCTNVTWQVDPLPFFVYAAAKKGHSLDEVERVLKHRFQTLANAAKAQSAQLPLLVTQLQMQSSALNRQIVEQQSNMLQAQRGMDKQRAIGMVVAQAALNMGMMDPLLGPDPAKTSQRLKALNGAKLRRLIDDSLHEDKMFVTYVVPLP